MVRLRRQKKKKNCLSVSLKNTNPLNRSPLLDDLLLMSNRKTGRKIRDIRHFLNRWKVHSGLWIQRFGQNNFNIIWCLKNSTRIENKVCECGWNDWSIGGSVGLNVQWGVIYRLWDSLGSIVMPLRDLHRLSARRLAVIVGACQWVKFFLSKSQHDWGMLITLAFPQQNYCYRAARSVGYRLHVTLTSERDSDKAHCVISLT